MRDFTWEHLIDPKISVLMEARGDSTATDYTEEVDEEEVTVPEESEGNVVEDEEEDTPTDYTSEVGDETESESDDNTPDTDDPPDETESEEDEPTDYTEDTPTDDGESEEETESEETGDGGDETNPSDNVTNEEEIDSKLKNIDLHDTYIYLYNRIRDFEAKLFNVQKSSRIINKIITQVTNNLVNLKTAVSEYIIYSFENNSYVRNLYNYNHFLESLRLNMIIMGKIKDLIPDPQNN